MGVTGLWRLIEPAGKPVPVETLENKVLAVDISIWLHQMVKGYQDAKGAPVPNAHLIGLFQRLCKLLYFRIKPIFVFDGGFPDLKKDTIGKRQANKAKYNSESERIKRELTILLGKKTAIGSLLGKKIPIKTTNNIESSDDIFKLPALPEKDEDSESESEDEKSSSSSSIDLHTIDLESKKFKNLPAKEKYDLLVELKETRKMNSWGKLHTLPKKSDNFSDFQMQRLLKRRKLQECLEETEKEIGEGSMSLNELESLLNEEGIDTKIESLPSRRIASNEKTRFLLISNVKQALAEAKKKDTNKKSASPPNDMTEQITKIESKESSSKKDELEDDLQRAIKMSLECVDDHDVSASTSKTDDSWTSNFTDSEYSDSEDEDGFVQPDNLSSAKAYIMQYTDLTDKAITEIVTSNQKEKKKSTGLSVDKIIEELSNEKTIIEERIDLSSTEEDCNQSFPIPNQASITDPKTDSQITKDIDTEASIVCIEHDNDEIIPLDTSTEDDIIEEKIIIDHKEKKSHGNNKYNEAKECQAKSADTLTSMEDFKTPSKSIVLCNPEIEVKMETDLESESSEDEFEEVSDDSNFKVPVVQLTFNVNEKIEDDIFADIFDKNLENRNNNSDQRNAERVTSNVKVTITDSLKQLSQTNDQSTELNENIIPKPLEHADKMKLSKELPTTSSVSNQILSSASLKNKINSIILDAKEGESLVRTKRIQDVKERNIIGSTSKNIPDTVPDKNIAKSPESNASAVIESQLVSSVNEISSSISEDKLNSIALSIQEQEDNLVLEKSKLDRVGRNITEQITKEAQELLQIFGIPYIIAPMEAEAQCAFLESVKLTDGTITDDSDIWLFGGQTVYKNFFNQKKHVLQYLSERIEKSFNLTREQLILLALLVGSDYTTGISGVGPVTALEILASFPFNNKKMIAEQSKQARYQEMLMGLIDFKKWVKAGKRTDNISLKKKLKNVNLTDDFPSVRVIQAYLEPNVEKSEEKFTWGNIDVTILRDYTKAKFGWSQNKLDEIIKPVFKRIQDRKNQKSVQDYFKRKTDLQSLEDQMSKRVKAAVQKIGPHASVPNNEPATKITRKRKLPASKTTCDTAENTNVLNNISHPSTSKRPKDADNVNIISQIVKTQEVHDNDKKISIDISKSQRVQEIIPQREKDKQNMLQNKLKAIEMFRKTKIDRKTKTSKRKLPKPKEDAELSESSDSN